MEKITVKIDGMMCGMCEAHICDALRAAFPDAKKVRASRRSGQATMLLGQAPDGSALEKAVSDTGYTFVSFSSEPYKKRGLFG